MDALKIKTVFWQKESVIPNTPWKIRGYSRSAFRTGFYLPDLDLMLDAGPQNFNHPSTIMITHTHIDHIASLPFTMIGSEEILQVYGPSDARKYVESYIGAMFEANSLTKIDKMDHIFQYHPLKPGTIFPITLNKNDLEIEVFECDHTIPTISYGISQIKQKLKPEYRGLPGKELGTLRKSGTQITHQVTTKSLAYVCDTSIKVFDLNPNLLSYPTIMIECTFFLPDELENAGKTNHIHWEQLKPQVLAHPEINFILFHFSQRYRDQEVLDFFQSEKDQDQISNLSCWVGI